MLLTEPSIQKNKFKHMYKEASIAESLTEKEKIHLTTWARKWTRRLQTQRSHEWVVFVCVCVCLGLCVCWAG